MNRDNSVKVLMTEDGIQKLSEIICKVLRGEELEEEDLKPIEEYEKVYNIENNIYEYWDIHLERKYKELYYIAKEINLNQKSISILKDCIANPKHTEYIKDLESLLSNDKDNLDKIIEEYPKVLVDTKEYIDGGTANKKLVELLDNLNNYTHKHYNYRLIVSFLFGVISTTIISNII